jgi:urease accessory protein
MQTNRFDSNENGAHTMSLKPSRAIVLTVLCLFAETAYAHPGHPPTGFVSGLGHPFLGVDHLLAMIAIGLWAAQQGGRALWAVPSAFAGAMVLGGTLAWSGWALPHVETGIALSVLILGLLIASLRNVPLLAGMTLAGVFALFHGYAHGLEIPQATSPVFYAAGFVLATVCLHGIGIVCSLFGRHAMRMAGIGIAATGLVLVLGT